MRRLLLLAWLLVLLGAAPAWAQKELWANNATSTLASGITSGATSLTVQTGDGAKFPTIGGSDYFYATLEEGTTREVVKVTARSTDTFTVTRAQCGSSASAFNATTKVENRLTKCALEDLQDFAAGGVGALPIVNGGTGQTTQTAAYDALSPLTTQGDIAYHNGTDVVRLEKGTALQHLRINSGATAPEWATDWTHVTLSADRTSAVTSLADVTDLSFSLAASTNYEIECKLAYTANATTTGILLSYTGATSPTLASGIAQTTTGGVNLAAADSGVATTSSTVATPTLNYALLAMNYRNSTNTGTWQLRFASEVAVANGIIIKAGSFCKYRTY